MAGYIDLKKLNLDELVGVVNLYPWFSGARKELCLRMSSMGEDMWSEAQYAEAAMYLPSRRILSDLIRSARTQDWEDADVEAVIKSYISSDRKKQSEAPARASEIVEREIKYLEGANNLLEKKLSDYNTEIIRIEASGMAPEELEAEIESAEEELEVASIHRDALELAMSLMEKSRGDIRSNVLPKISSRASELFSRFTGGKYRSLYFDNEFDTLHCLWRGK